MQSKHTRQLLLPVAQTPPDSNTCPHPNCEPGPNFPSRGQSSSGTTAKAPISDPLDRLLHSGDATRPVLAPGAQTHRWDKGFTGEGCFGKALVVFPVTKQMFLRDPAVLLVSTQEDQTQGFTSDPKPVHSLQHFQPQVESPGHLVAREHKKFHLNLGLVPVRENLWALEPATVKLNLKIRWFTVLHHQHMQTCDPTTWHLQKGDSGCRRWSAETAWAW